MILMIDNYDSFTYNLVQVLRGLGEEVRVFRNDQLTLSQAKRLKAKALVISPGPGTPQSAGASGATSAGITNTLIKYFYRQIPILGICLGEQCLAYVLGGKVIRARKPVHGKTAQIYHDGRTIFAGLTNPFWAARYHSLIVDENSLRGVFEVSSYTKEGEVMGIRMKDWPVEGVQFHPESFLTEEGIDLLNNFIKML